MWSGSEGYISAIGADMSGAMLCRTPTFSPSVGVGHAGRRCGFYGYPGFLWSAFQNG